MKRHLLIFVIVLFFPLYAIKNRFSQTFLFTRPAYQRLDAYESFWENMEFKDDCEPHLNMQVILFGQKSNNRDCDGHHIRQYFLMEGKNELSVKGDDVNKFDRDIRAEWLNLPSTFNGSFTLIPQQKQFGVLVDVRQDLAGCMDSKFFDTFWVGVTVPFVYVQNNLNLEQNFFKAAPTKPHTILEALANPGFIYNRMFQCNSTVGIPEFKVSLGVYFKPLNSLQLATRSGVIFPITNKQNGQIFFEAVKGFNRHLGWESVVNIQFPVTCNDVCKTLYYLDISSVYFFSNKQYRTFDLINKPYSRYLLLNDTNGTVNIPAINVLTQRVKVKPFNIVDVSTGFRIKTGGFEGQIGYSLWAHGNERVHLVHPWKEEFGIAAEPGEVTPSGLPATASHSTIKTLAPTDKDAGGSNAFKKITKNDLDFLSGSSRGTVTNNASAAIGWICDRPHVCGFVGIGAFVEFPMNNAALRQWGGWFKFGASI